MLLEKLHIINLYTQFYIVDLGIINLISWLKYFFGSKITEFLLLLLKTGFTFNST